MKIFNFGSLNIDYIYRVNNFVQAGETISSLNFEAFPGGKGLNQSVAISKAGGNVYHVGSIGADGDMLLQELIKAGVSVDFIKNSKNRTGHAIIQVNREGQNCIIIAPGANFDITADDIDLALSNAQIGDIVLLQNEVNNISEIMKKAKEKNLKVIFNPSPITAEMADYPLELVDTFMLNEIEGSYLSDKKEPQEILDTLQNKYPNAEIILTLGIEGSIYKKKDIQYFIPPRKVTAVDTTGAGDTFCGYYIASISNNIDIESSLVRATVAASIAVTRAGASTSVPYSSEVDSILYSS